MNFKRILGILFLAICSCSFGQVTFAGLLDEMCNRGSLCRYPEPSFRCIQYSSYDRASKSPDQPGWFANGDSSKFIRSERNEQAGGREEWVLLEAEGPGAIVRVWITAKAYACNLYVYLDGGKEPAFSGKIDDLVGGTGLAGVPFSEVTARGRNLYLPIPYGKSAKVTVDQMPLQKNLYYQINVREYAEGTRVESLNRQVLDAAKDKVMQAGRRLLDGSVSGSQVSELPLGSHRIDEFSVRLESDDMTLALRRTIVKMTFDGEMTVWCPLGDFFGTGIGVNPYKTWFTEVVEEGKDAVRMRLRFPMPYRRQAQVEFERLGGVKSKVEASFVVTPYVWDGRSMLFHSDWRSEFEIATLAGKGLKDWNYATLQGKGIFVGDCLSVVNRDAAWWGEGDEKIYVDGESFPSHFGTGTEDYYGYAWCSPERFESAWRAQPRVEGPRNFGNTTNLRFRSLDGIPFEKSFRFDMEIWHWKATKVDYAVSVFWYGMPGAKYEGASHETRAQWALNPVSYETPLSLSLSTFRVVARPQGTVTYQGMKQFSKGKWVDDTQIWWRDGKPGDTLSMETEVAKAGGTALHLGVTCAVDYGVFEFFWDDVKIGEVYDLYVPAAEGVIRRELVLPLKPNQASTGKHRLEARLVGKSRDSRGTMFGLDSVVVK